MQSAKTLCGEQLTDYGWTFVCDREDGHTFDHSAPPMEPGAPRRMWVRTTGAVPKLDVDEEREPDPAPIDTASRAEPCVYCDRIDGRNPERVNGLRCGWGIRTDTIGTSVAPSGTATIRRCSRELDHDGDHVFCKTHEDGTIHHEAETWAQPDAEGLGEEPEEPEESKRCSANGWRAGHTFQCDQALRHGGAHIAPDFTRAKPGLFSWYDDDEPCSYCDRIDGRDPERSRTARCVWGCRTDLLPEPCPSAPKGVEVRVCGRERNHPGDHVLCNTLDDHSIEHEAETWDRVDSQRLAELSGGHLLPHVCSEPEFVAASDDICPACEISQPGHERPIVNPREAVCRNASECCGDLKEFTDLVTLPCTRARRHDGEHAYYTPDGVKVRRWDRVVSIAGDAPAAGLEPAFATVRGVRVPTNDAARSEAHREHIAELDAAIDAGEAERIKEGWEAVPGQSAEIDRSGGLLMICAARCKRLPSGPDHVCDLEPGHEGMHSHLTVAGKFEWLGDPIDTAEQPDAAAALEAASEALAAGKKICHNAEPGTAGGIRCNLEPGHEGAHTYRSPLGKALETWAQKPAAAALEAGTPDRTCEHDRAMWFGHDEPAIVDDAGGLHRTDCPDVRQPRPRDLRRLFEKTIAALLEIDLSTENAYQSVIAVGVMAKLSLDAWLVAAGELPEGEAEASPLRAAFVSGSAGEQRRQLDVWRLVVKLEGGKGTLEGIYAAKVILDILENLEERLPAPPGDAPPPPDSPQPKDVREGRFPR